MDEKQAIARRLDPKVRASGKSHRALHRETGVSVRALSDARRGRFRLSAAKAEALAPALGTTAAWLLDGQTPEWAPAPAAVVADEGEAPPPEVLPQESRDTLRRLLEAAPSANTRLAWASDMRYWRAWCRVTFGRELLPATVQTVLRFIADHAEPMTAAWRGRIHQEMAPETGRRASAVVDGQPSPRSVARRLSTLAMAHRTAGWVNPCNDDRVRQALRALRRTGAPARRATAATKDVLDEMLEDCATDARAGLAWSRRRTLRGLRDAAVLLVGATSGRRRSEIVALDVEDLTLLEDGDYVAQLRRSKTDPEGRGHHFSIRGRAAAALRAWLEAARLDSGPVFRAVSKGGEIGAARLSDRAVSLIVKARVRATGRDPRGWSGHSLRSGFVTQTGRKGFPLGDAMALSGHRSVAVAMGYYQSGAVSRNDAALAFE